jgi:hypothetical protein
MQEKLLFLSSHRYQRAAKTLFESVSPTIRMIVMMFTKPIFLLTYEAIMEQVAPDRLPPPQNRELKSN